MTLYTMMPMELVLQGYDDDREETVEITARGIRMQVVPVAPGMGRIVRLLDCKLDDYLDPGLTPGTIVPFDGAASRRS
jgi:hypothetical protein